jgi:hypothetical protein
MNELRREEGDDAARRPIAAMHGARAAADT